MQRCPISHSFLSCHMNLEVLLWVTGEIKMIIIWYWVVHKVVFIFATLSTLTLLSVALRAVWLPIRRHLLLTATPKQEHIVFFNTHFGRYGACLLLAIALSTTGGIIGIFWLHRQGIAEGLVAFFESYFSILTFIPTQVGFVTFKV